MTDETQTRKIQKINVEGNVDHSGLVIGNWNRVIIINEKIESSILKESVNPSQKLTSNPYKGLASFQESDAELYFGRQTLIEELLDKFKALYRNSLYIGEITRFITIFGPSGCGKSSLVMAGLVPAFEQNPLPDKEAIRAVILRPGKKPVSTLVRALCQLTREDKAVGDNWTEEYVRKFRDASREDNYEILDTIASSILDAESRPILIIIDQLEQIYSHCEDDNERITFIENLIYAAKQKSGYISVIATLRSDFIESAQNSSLNKVIAPKNLFTVRPMTEDELYLAIAKPAEATQYPLDSGIIGHLVKDAIGKKGVLPLLQFTLRKIWEGLSLGIKPMKTYCALGSIGGALATQAQEIYESLPTEKEKDIAKRVFLSLVQTREGVPDTGRPVILKDLVTKQDNLNQIREVIQIFASPSVRLLTLDSDKNREHETVEITHEALFRNWDQFEKWLKDNREFIGWHEQLRASKKQWITNQKDNYSLLQGKALEEAEKQIEDYSSQLNEQEHQYIQLSLKLRHERLQKKRKQKLRSFMALTTIFSLITCGISIYSFRTVLFQSELETVLLEADSSMPGIENKLPIFLEKAHNYRESLDTFLYQKNHNEALSFYQKNQEDIDKMMAFYKRIIEISKAIQSKYKNKKLSNESINSELEIVRQSAEKSLSEILYKYSIPKLKIDLDNDDFGEYQGGSGLPVNRFTEGALKTTYQIIVEDAGGDLDLNGEIENIVEASHIPCQVLLDIEAAWLTSSKAIGWQASNPENFEVESLSFLVFDSAGPFINSRIRNCGKSVLSNTH